MKIRHVPLQQIRPTEGIVRPWAVMIAPHNWTRESLGPPVVAERLSTEIFEETEAPSTTRHKTEKFVSILQNFTR